MKRLRLPTAASEACLSERSERVVINFNQIVSATLDVITTVYAAVSISQM